MDEVITDLKQVTSDWLTAVLQGNGHLEDNQVTGVTVKSSRQTLISNTHHLELTYAAPPPAKLPSKLFLKYSKADFDPEITARFGKKETEYYHVIAKAMDAPPSALCFDAVFSPEIGKSHILLADLSESHFQTDWPLPPSKRHCEAVLDRLARFHAAWWDHRELGQSIGKFSTIDSMDEYMKSMEKKYADFADFLDDRLSPARRRLYERVLSMAPTVWKRRLCGGEPGDQALTLIHGDAHFWNCLHPRDLDKEKPYIIDWQCWRIDTATDDMAYMIGLHWYPDRRRAMEQDLLRYYFERLLFYGVRKYDWNALWYDYRLSLVSNLFIPVWQWSAKLWAAIWWPHLERAFLAFEDLQCEELLTS